MRIDLGRGIENVLFGATKQQVVKLWGDADKDYADESGDQCLAYFSRKVALRFERAQNFKLTWVECANPETELLGENAFKLSIDELTYKIETRSAEEPETFEHGWLETFFYAEDWLELQLQFGTLSALNFGVFYDVQDRPLWPKP